jgi:hypothetical protein
VHDHVTRVVQHATPAIVAAGSTITHVPCMHTTTTRTISVSRGASMLAVTPDSSRLQEDFNSGSTSAVIVAIPMIPIRPMVQQLMMVQQNATDYAKLNDFNAAKVPAAEIGGTVSTTSQPFQRRELCSNELKGTLHFHLTLRYTLREDSITRWNGTCGGRRYECANWVSIV